jgi:hypothetical protein
MVVNGSGNVGIGTTSPSEKLHISSGYALVENTGIGSSIIINRTDGKALNLKAGSGAGQFTFDNTGFFAISSDTKTNVLSGAGSGNQVFVVTGSGNVGIGTTSPSSLLTLNSAGTLATGLTLDNAGSKGYLFGDGSSLSLRAGSSHGITISAGAAALQAFNGPGNFLINLQAPTTLPIYTFYQDADTGMGRPSANRLAFFAGGERMRITDTGNVGIGTTAPAAKLDVNGGVRVADDAATASATNVGTLRYRTSGNNSYVDMCMQTGAATYAWVNIVQNNW